MNFVMQIEIKSSDGSEIQGAYEELYVHISADTFEKVDAAVSVIELLVTSVSVSFKFRFHNILAITVSVLIESIQPAFCYNSIILSI